MRSRLLPLGLPLFEGVFGAEHGSGSSTSSTSSSVSASPRTSSAMAASCASSSSSLTSSADCFCNVLALFLRADRSLRTAVGVSSPCSSVGLDGVPKSTRLLRFTSESGSLMPLAFVGVPFKIDLRFEGVSVAREGLAISLSCLLVLLLFLGVEVSPSSVSSILRRLGIVAQK